MLGKGCRATLQDREKLPYTEATICEMLRLGCTAPTTLPHCTMVDTEIAGYRIPANTEVQN